MTITEIEDTVTQAAPKAHMIQFADFAAALIEHNVTDSHGNPVDPGEELMDMFADPDERSLYAYIIGVPVTPSMARRIVGLNIENNRRLKNHVVARYARDMSNGRWRVQTGQSIKLCKLGKLIDGQHRLQAVIASGKTTVFDFTIGIDAADIAVLDSGVRRSDADVIRTSGGGDISRATPIVKHILAWENGSPKGPSGSTTATALEIQERYLVDDGLFEAAAARGYDCGRRNVGTPAAMGVAYFLLVKAADNKGAVDDFYDQLVSGVYPVTDVSLHGPYRLREKLIQYRQSKLSRAEMIALVVRIWNRYNTLDADGRRVPVERVQAVRSADGEGLTNLNFPKPIKALADRG